MAHQLAQSRSSRRETHYLLRHPTNATRLQDSSEQGHQGLGIVVEFVDSDELIERPPYPH
ncbi:MAG: hypothetical protein ACOH2L_00845 [Devosia sp.]